MLDEARYDSLSWSPDTKAQPAYPQVNRCPESLRSSGNYILEKLLAMRPGKGEHRLAGWLHRSLTSEKRPQRAVTERHCRRHVTLAIRVHQAAEQLVVNVGVEHGDREQIDRQGHWVNPDPQASDADMFRRSSLGQALIGVPRLVIDRLIMLLRLSEELFGVFADHALPQVKVTTFALLRVLCGLEHADGHDLVEPACMCHLRGIAPMQDTRRPPSSAVVADRQRADSERRSSPDERARITDSRAEWKIHEIRGKPASLPSSELVTDGLSHIDTIEIAPTAERQPRRIAAKVDVHHPVHPPIVEDRRPGEHVHRLAVRRVGTSGRVDRTDTCRRPPFAVDDSRCSHTAPPERDVCQFERLIRQPVWSRQQRRPSDT